MKNLLHHPLQQINEAFQLPGMAALAIHNGEITVREEFGYRDLTAKLPFTTDTLCLVASATKSFTAGLTGRLVDRGLVEWTRPVRHYLPNFKMVDQFATREITLEDMLCHRSGLPWHENLLAHGVGRECSDDGRAFRADLLRRLAYFEPSSPFRANFVYQDVVFTCAGAILEHITNEPYETLIDQQLLQPLNLRDSTFERSKARATGRLAQPFGLIDGSVGPIPFCDTRYFAPSAGLYSTATEMIEWVKLQLNRGRHHDRQLISKAGMAWIHRPHVVAPNAAAMFGGGLTTYGQGWFQNALHGRTLIAHGGSFNGYRTFMGFVPEENIGAVVLTNLNVTEGVSAAGLLILDHLLGIENTVDERIAHFQQRAQWFATWEEQQKEAFMAGQNPANRPRHALEAYQGEYTHPGYGTFSITYDGSTLQQTYDGRTFPLNLYNGETFGSRFQTTENRVLPMTFTFESSGPVTAVRVPIIEDIPIPRFVRD
ncbi:MAG: serine hydrolase [Ardenticatenaceae bacterium]|nr:serine hydrolase [Ardenticatenaceae bacterium]